MFKRKHLPPRLDGKPRRKLRRKNPNAADMAKRGAIRFSWDALFKKLPRV